MSSRRKFMSSDISKLWADGTGDGDSTRKGKRRRKEDEEEKDEALVITEKDLVALGRKQHHLSERSRYEQQLSELKKQGKRMNYAVMQKKIQRLKELEKQQDERDKELGGGSAIIKRKKLTLAGKKSRDKERKSQKLIIHQEGTYVNKGAVSVSRKMISKNTGPSKFDL